MLILILVFQLSTTVSYGTFITHAMFVMYYGMPFVFVLFHCDAARVPPLFVGFADVGFSP